MKRAKCLVLSAMLCLGLAAGGPAMTMHAEEAAIEAECSIGTAVSMEDSVGEFEESVVSASTGQNISGISFQYAEVRTPSNTRVFNGGDGKYHVVVYGGVGSCGNTNSALDALSKMTAFMDLNKIEINVFDVSNNSAETITGSLSANVISTDIKVCKTRGDLGLFNTCAGAAGINGSYTMPLITYVNTKGDIVKATTGYATSAEIQNNIEAMGLDVNMEASYQVLDITGTVDYASAFKVLELLNADRAEGGLAALTMDPGLLETAMQRAAECSLFYNHTRPNGESCFSLDSKMYRENIAIGYTSAASVQEAWMKSTAHNANIMAAENKSVGIGVFCINGTYYWVQCFGNSATVNATQPANTNRTYSIQTVQDKVDPYLKQNSFSLKRKGEVAQFEVWVTNKEWNTAAVRVNGNSYNWSSDNADFTITADGKVTAKKWGSANITAANKNNANYNMLGTVKLSTDANISNTGIYLAEVTGTDILAGMTYTVPEGTDVEFSWQVSKDGKNWTNIQGWTENNEWIRWSPGAFGDYTLRCIARVPGNPSSGASESIPISYHPHIKGKCQMPYTGEGGGFLIGVETYDNPNQSYTYEMLILDCTLLAQGKDAWVYSTGRCGVPQGNALWTIWQPQYGYYWTLFRVYDANGNLIDEVCYGFQNI